MSSLCPDAIAAVHAINRLNRRDFMRFASLAGALGVVGIPAMAKAAVPAGIKFMGETEYAVFKRVAEISLPTQGTPLVPLAEIPVMQTLDAALLGTMEPHILNGLKGGIAFFNNGPVAAFGKPFTALTDQQAAAFCEQWAASGEVPHRALVVGLKKLVGLAYWANPPTWAPLGYDGPVSERWNLAPRGNQPLPTA